MNSKGNKQIKFTRRSFLKGGAALGGISLLSPMLAIGSPQEGAWLDDPYGTGHDNQDYGAENVIYSLCQQCNTFCTIKAIVIPQKGDGPHTSIVRKIAGNPYSPLTMQPFGQIPYKTSVKAAAKGKENVAKDGRGFRGGRTCLKGQAGIQTAYDAFRVQKPLKRVGPRGNGKWQSISWEQAIKEIVNGGDLGTPGTKQSWAYIPEKPVMGDWEKVKKGEISQEDFDKKYQDVLIDTKHPDFGPKSNQLVFLAGDRTSFFIDRLWNQTFGSANAFNHGGYCGMSGVIANVRSFTSPSPKKRMYGDIDHSQFHIVWGTDPLVANKGPTWLAPKYMNALQRGMKLAVIDPRMSRIAEKAQAWVPIKPGTDAAFAFGMARWIIENNRYDARYLQNPNIEAAALDKEPTWSDATFLVAISEKGKPKLRAKVLGIGNEKQFVVIENGQAVPADKSAEGQLEVDMTLNGIQVKSAFTLFKERVMEKTIEEYAKICEVEPQQIIELAKEFTSHGKKASITSYRGPAMRVNGYYNIRAINMLNHLIGNYDWKGGSISAGANFKPLDGRYKLNQVPKAHNAWGLKLVREKAVYEKSSLFSKDGYPTKRPWFVLGGNLIHEVLPSASDQYPYGIKALFIHRTSPIMSSPGGGKQVEILKDTKAIPLLVCSDIVIGETSMYADYILPDITYLERWGLESIYPNQELKLTQIQQPITRVYPETRPAEDTFIEIAKQMGLPGVGENAFSDGSSLYRAEDFYLKAVANIAFAGEAVPDADAEEITIFETARKQALGTFFDLAAWKKAVKPEEWAKVVYVLNRGGRFEAFGQGYEGDYIKYKLAAEADFYDEVAARAKNSFTGKPFDGLPKITGVTFYNGKEVPTDGYPLTFINWKSRNIGTHRGIVSAWLREIEGENLLWINPVDAQTRGLKNGDKVKIKSPSHEVTGSVLVTERIRPGVVGTPYNYGHFAYGSRPVEIDNKMIEGVKPYGHTNWVAGMPRTGYAKGRDTGFSANDLLQLDISYKNAGMVDPIGGGAAQLDTRVEVSKI
ncbi:molybdopterin-dependent oxidoreductase [Desulfosporosinus sp. BICA1-9]|uniref:molybdopterin-dependent oxidoreductase n=1 Tax=Desulfosporosinus sp. BICA1-9 TaxID=1531958 RepID=UPI00054B261C|nr:molybdopterin-dependent oxidoreductase [Desulfosporosinus sp. BICA1-9]KJS47325.1 MAG: molybdopterin oxidoreductase [Peptococcaceae bacterium BRH_c23]KJS81918.1 MAG: molybdopterin oxidoreductase [Desulfosporosinus sp. BICA1-9]HBW39143.1 tetrathionate reductase subunit A [Desulfosporosinus sp.]